MTMQDPIADMLTRIRNAQVLRKKSVSLPASTIKSRICQVLKDEGYILDYAVNADKKPTLTIELKYYRNVPVIREIKRVSRPGLRAYQTRDNLPSVMNGLGIAIVSTSAGVMTEKAARAAGHGGEVLCYVA